MCSTLENFASAASYTYLKNVVNAAQLSSFLFPRGFHLLTPRQNDGCRILWLKFLFTFPLQM